MHRAIVRVRLAANLLDTESYSVHHLRTGSRVFGMDENLSRGYVALAKHGNVCPLATPPVDHLGKTFLAMVLAGAGFLFPYNRYLCT